MVREPLLIGVCLSEDSDQAVDVIKRLLRVLLLSIDPHVQTQHIRLEPYEATHRPAVVANAWLSTKPRDQQKVTELNKYLARRLKAQTFTIIVHHFDADCAWNSQQDCSHLKRWREIVWQAVTRLTDETTAQRLVPLVPHPEIEAWLYLNHDVLEQEAQRAGQEIPCPPKGGWDGISDQKGVKDWQPWPRDTLNQLLAKTLPIDKARQDSPSLAAAVQGLMAIPQLKEILEKTWQYDGFL